MGISCGKVLGGFMTVACPLLRQGVGETQGWHAGACDQLNVHLDF